MEPGAVSDSSQVVGQLVARWGHQLELDATAPVRSKHLVWVGGRQRKDHMRRWFLQQFEKRLTAGVGQAVRFVNDENPVAAQHGSERCPSGKVNHVFFQSMRCGIELDDIRVGAVNERHT